MTQYRIVNDDRYAGFAVKSWRWWWPFWVRPANNTFGSIERAEKWAHVYAAGGFVKDLGELPSCVDREDRA